MIQGKGAPPLPERRYVATPQEARLVWLRWSLRPPLAEEVALFGKRNGAVPFTASVMSQNSYMISTEVKRSSIPDSASNRTVSFPKAARNRDWWCEIDPNKATVCLF